MRNKINVNRKQQWLYGKMMGFLFETFLYLFNVKPWMYIIFINAILYFITIIGKK